jgi:hypothetical protein
MLSGPPRAGTFFCATLAACKATSWPNGPNRPNRPKGDVEWSKSS